MLVYLGLQDKMVTTANGDQNDSLFMAYGCFNHEAWADLPAASAGGYGEILPEVILEANPDIILCTYEEDIVNSIEEQLGRSVVAAPQGTLFGEDYKLALRVFGDACGVPERAEEVISFMDNCLADLDARTKDIPDEDKPPPSAAGTASKAFTPTTRFSLPFTRTTLPPASSKAPTA